MEQIFFISSKIIQFLIEPLNLLFLISGLALFFFGLGCDSVFEFSSFFTEEVLSEVDMEGEIGFFGVEKSAVFFGKESIGEETLFDSPFGERICISDELGLVEVLEYRLGVGE